MWEVTVESMVEFSDGGKIIVIFNNNNKNV